jgi:hypothetical protein
MHEDFLKDGWHISTWVVVVLAATWALAQTVPTTQPPPIPPPATQGRDAAPPPERTASRPPAIFPDAGPLRPCDSLRSLSLSDTTIESASIQEADGSSTCVVHATVTHPPAGDSVKVWIWLPVKDWNGRFQGMGGGGMSGGSEGSLRAPVSLGYAAGATDTGHTGGSGSFALDSKGRLNWALIRDNSYVGIHDMTIVGKALTEAFYARAPRYSYFNGCSTGGRQGLMEAQRYAADYNGVLAGAPAINFTKLHPEQLWGHLVMLESHNIVPICKMNAATAAAIAACDTIDGVKDGIIEDPKRCTYDPKALIGTAAGDCGPINQADADVIRQIWQGPRRRDGSFLWYGLPRGGAFTLSATGGIPLAGRPFGITLDWFRYFLTQNPEWDWTTITRDGYEQLWDQSVEEFSAVIATDNPDLTAFRDRGGRIVLWHGWADQLIYAEGTIDYFKRVQQQMGGRESTARFMRLFMAPGVGHCGGGDGPAPSGQLDALLRWVEQGAAPEILNAVRRDRSGTTTRSRPLCQYPLVARYKGVGSTDEAAGFECRATF